MRILVLIGGGIGDVILTFPLFEALRREHPDVILMVWGPARTNRLLTHFGLADETEADDGAVAFSLYREPESQCLSHIDRAISLWSDDDGRIAAALRERGVREVVSIPPVARSRPGTHASEQVLRAVFADGRRSVVAREAARPPDERNETLFIAPGSGSPTKNWPLENFQAVADQWSRGSGSVVWVLGEAERDWQVRGGEVLRERPWVELAQCLAEPGVTVLGNDSGFAHLAGWLGCRGVVLFGLTDSVVWRPLGEGIRVVQSESGTMDAVSVAKVMDAFVDGV